MNKDLPEIIQKQREKYPDVKMEITGNIGADSRLTQILLDRIREVV